MTTQLIVHNKDHEHILSLAVLAHFGLKTSHGVVLKKTVISTEALRSTYLLIFPLDVPTLLAVENGVAACGLFVSFRCAPGLPRRSMYEKREGG
jgi:hypothetical protein